MKHTVESSHNGKTIQVYAGDEVEISLAANPTTGYRWELEKNEETLLTLKQDYVPAPGSLIGRGGTQLFTFVAETAGTIHLHLKYWRSFVGDKSITQRFSVTFQIQEQPESI